VGIGPAVIAGSLSGPLITLSEQFDKICSVDCKIAESDRDVQREGRLCELQESFEVGSLIQ
jgi:hypothetical protein